MCHLAPGRPLVPCSRGHRSPDERSARAGARPAGRAGRVRLAHRRGHRALRRQGSVAEEARGVLLRERQPRPQERGARVAGRVDRVDRGRQRERGAAARAAADQAPSAAPECAPARRQVVPVHRRDARRRVPARALHARAAPHRRALLRALRVGAEGAHHARDAQQDLPVPAVRGPCAGPALGRAVPRLPHRALRGTVRGPDHARGLPRRDRRRDRVPRGTHEQDRARSRAAHARRLRAAPVRGGRARPQPAHGRAPPQRAPGRRRRLRHLRRDRAGGRERRRQRPAAGGARRAHRGAPLALPGERRGGGRGRAAGAVPARLLRHPGRHPAADLRAHGGRGRRSRGGLPGSAARRGRPAAGRRARRQAARRRDGAAQRRARRAARRPARAAHAHAPHRGARGAARVAQPRGAADPHRVLRHLEPPGHERGGLDGRVRGRRRQALRLPPLRHPARRGPGRLPLARRGRDAALRASPPRRRRRLRPQLRDAPEPARDRRRQGPAGRRARRHARVRPAARRRRLAGQARGGGLPPRPGRSP